VVLQYSILARHRMSLALCWMSGKVERCQLSLNEPLFKQSMPNSSRKPEDHMARCGCGHLTTRRYR
jgi:hypothetical protein